MAVPTAITDLSTTASLNSPSGSDTVGTTMDDFLRAHASFIAQLYSSSTTNVPTGMVFDYVGSSAPTGYVMLSGRTIGDASSAATERANSDTSDLYTLLWNSMSDTEAPVSSGRGASAAADFAAHKTITLPDARGRVIAGKDNMGGSAANRLTAAGSGITGTTLGTAGGAETHTLTTAQLASHSHNAGGSLTIPADTTGGGFGTTGLVGSNATNATVAATGATASAGSGNAHNNTQPTLIMNKVVKL